MRDYEHLTWILATSFPFSSQCQNMAFHTFFLSFDLIILLTINNRYAKTQRILESTERF